MSLISFAKKKLHLFFLLVVISISTQHIQAQTPTAVTDVTTASTLQTPTFYLAIADSLVKIGVLDEAMAYTEKALYQYEKQKDWAAYIKACQEMGYWFYRIDQYKEALGLLHKALEQDKKHPIGEQFSLITTYTHLADVYRVKGNYDKALDYLLKALTLQQKKYENTYHTSISETYSKIATVYYYSSNYEASLAYNKKALNMQLQIYRENDPNVAHTYNNIGLIYVTLKQYDIAIENYNKSINILQYVYTDKHPKLASNYSNLAIAYKKQKNYDQAVEASEKALLILKENFDYIHPGFIKNYNTLGDIYLDKKDYTSALLAYQEALNRRLEVLNNKHPLVAANYLLIGKVYEEQKNFDSALAEYQKALLSLLPAVNELALYDSQLNWKSSYSKTYLLTVLEAKAKALENRYTAKKEVKDLQAALQNYQLAADVIDNICQYDVIYNYKDFVFSDVLSVYEGGLKVVQKLVEVTKDPELRYLSIAFNLVERYRQVTWLYNLDVTKVESFMNVPTVLIEQEKNLKTDIMFAKKRLLDEEQNGEFANTSQLTKFQKAVVALQKEYAELQRLLEKDYTDYYNLKYNYGIINLSDTQEKLKNNNPSTALLSYFVGDSLTYLLVITADLAWMETINFADKEKNKIEELNQCLTDYNFITKKYEAAYQTYIEKGFAVFQILLAPILPKLPAVIEHLMIIPDKKINSVSFDALLTEAVDKEEKADYRLLPYLLNKYKISYDCSINSFYGLEQLTQSVTASKGYAGFGTFYERDRLSVAKDPTVARLIKESDEILNGQHDQIHTLSKVWPNNSFVNLNTSKKDFLAEAPKYNILHLAFHTLINDKHPLSSKIIFNPSLQAEKHHYLYTHEWYGMLWNVDLLVLNSVYQEVDSLFTGVGLQHLAQSLHFSGCNNLLLNLWRTEQPPITTSLFSNFYTNLHKGQTILTALHTAKKHFLEQDNQLKAHPYFWANIIHVGNSKSLDTKFASMTWVIFLLGGLFVLGGLVGWAKVKRKKETA